MFVIKIIVIVGWSNVLYFGESAVNVRIKLTRRLDVQHYYLVSLRVFLSLSADDNRNGGSNRHNNRGGMHSSHSDDDEDEEDYGDDTDMDDDEYFPHHHQMFQVNRPQSQSPRRTPAHESKHLMQLLFHWNQSWLHFRLFFLFLIGIFVHSAPKSIDCKQFTNIWRRFWRKKRWWCYRLSFR